MSVGRRVLQTFRSIAGASSQAGVVVLAAMGSAANGDWTVFGGKVSKQLLLIGSAGVLAVVNILIGELREKRLRESESVTARAVSAERAVLRLLRRELRSLQEKLHHYSNDRVSVFLCNGDAFILVGRRSEHPGFDGSLGRERYPLGEGCLGRAWENGMAEDPELPSPGASAPNPPTQQWLRAQLSRWGIANNVAASFTMRSRSYAAFRVRAQGADADRSIGVVVFESTLSVSDVAGSGVGHRITCAELEPFVKEAGDRLAQILENIEAIGWQRARAYLPEIQGAGGSVGGSLS